ncbi:DMT family transporter [Clostridium polynesiense]|uniref:DMT family transporter n=1 Tax=Clostridium polynesiense TaxID=1325933 RepID=UPI00058FC4CB|nr:DMT family transporter [Clostridium polynesiense]
MEKSNKLQGILYAVFSACAFGIIPIFAKFAYNAGANAITVVLLRFLFSVIILLFYFLYKKVNLKVDKKLLPKFAFLGIVGYAGTSITLFLSYNYITVGLATSIHFVYPAIVTLFSIMLFNEKLNYRKLLSLVFCIAGVYILIGFSEISLNISGIMLALASGVFYSLYILGIDYSNIRNIDTLVITFYVLVFSLLGTLVFGIMSKSLSFDFQAYGYASVAALSLVCTIIALSIFSKAIMIIGSSSAAILSTLEPITSIILSAIIFKEAITINTFLGSLLIISSVYVLITKKQGQ